MFTHQIKVRGFHCDLYGHVNNARYLEFLEEARWEWLSRHIPFFQSKNLILVVVSITIHYRSPSVLGDELTVSAEIKEIGKRSITVHQSVIRNVDEKLIAEADVTFALVDNASGRSVPLDDELKELVMSE